MKIIECGFADPEEISKIAILIHKINPKLSWFLYVVVKKGLRNLQEGKYEGRGS